MSNLKDKLDVASLGIEMGIAVTVGILFGQWVDGKLDSDPWATLFFMACGFGAAIKAVVRAARITRKSLADESTPDRSLVLPGDGGRYS